MFEDNSYEPIAEIYLTFVGQPSVNEIYCLCSRVFVDGANENDEETDRAVGVVVEEEVAEEVVKSANSVESTVRFSSLSTDSHPLNTFKKIHEETVSCYCSASHYSTDEHDSSRDISTLHHSDSGADLSESSRDLDWERYWTINGERLIWESWISKYGSYIDPNYLSSGGTTGETNKQQPAEGEEASFCVESDKLPDPNRKTSFSGLLDGLKTNCEGKTDIETFQNSSFEDKLEENNYCTPKILVEITKLSDEVSNRRLSDFSDTGKSLSGRSDDFSNLDDNERLRLNSYSRNSGSSVVLSATTDSMTNVTRITLSSSESSYGVDNSSGKSSSVLSSSDSGNSVDQQWQNLWAEHFNEQYYYHYNKFTEKIIKKKSAGANQVKSDSGFIVEESKVSNIIGPTDCEGTICFEPPKHQESVDEVGSIETQDSASQDSDNSKPPAGNESKKPSLKSDTVKTEKHLSRNQKLSVGYLLQQLNAMSVEPAEKIQEEDESANLLSCCSATESVKNNINDKNEGLISETKCENKHDLSLSNSNASDPTVVCVDTLEINSENHNNDNNMASCNQENDDYEPKKECNFDSEMKDSSDEDLETGIRHGVKRSHEEEDDESSVEKIKSAYQLMGLMYNLENTSKIRKASVWYKKRFSQIRFQNRVLRLQKPLPNKHIYFDDDDEACKQAHESTEPTEGGTQDKNSSAELFEDATEESGSLLQEHPELMEPRKLEMEEFSEKDDSTDDDQDIFFSAEEDNLMDMSHVWRENRARALPRRRKKRQSKKSKYVVNYPEEMIANPKIKKFWRRRYSLFSKFDEGIKMDAESWYSVTPEKIAINIAERCQCDVIIDAFCGAGGNAIQLAFTCERVIAIDIDPHKIELARHNARVYGVEDRIEFIVGDYLQLAPSLSADVVFLSPPWGGVEYNRTGVFPLASLLPVSGHLLYKLTAEITDNIALYLPRNVNTQELVECAGPGGCVEVVQNFLDRELVAVTAYFGDLVNSVE